MENKPSAQMVAWLDEERRKDKALIVKLEERTASQTALIEDQARRLQALEGELAALRATSLSAGFFDESVGRLRTEFITKLEQTRGNSKGQDVKKAQELINEGMHKALDGLRDELLARLDRELQPRRAEDDRLARVAIELQNYGDSLSKSHEESQRTLSFLEEQRRQDSRRLAELNSEASETGKRIEGIMAKSELLEEISRRNERSVAELSSAFLELKQERDAITEQSLLADRQREKLLNEALRRLEDNMASFNKQLETWTDTYRTMKKGVDDFERLKDRIERKLNENSEAQRLAEERLRREWEEFQQEEQKRFRQFTLTNEEAWRENAKLTSSMSERIGKLTALTDEISDQLASLTGAQKEILNTLVGSFQTLRERTDTNTGKPPAKKR